MCSLFFLIYSNSANQCRGEKWICIKLDIYHVPGIVPEKLQCKIIEMPNHIPYSMYPLFLSSFFFISFFYQSLFGLIQISLKGHRENWCLFPLRKVGENRIHTKNIKYQKINKDRELDLKKKKWEREKKSFYCKMWQQLAKV